MKVKTEKTIQTTNGAPTMAGIWTTYRRKIMATMSLLTAERLCAVAVPFVLGVAINDLIDGSYRGIWLLAGLEIFILVIGTGRRLYDTRVYAGIYTDIADRVAKRTATSVTKRAARLQLGRELVDFFEWELLQLVSAGIGIVGAFVMLVYLLPTVGAISIGVATVIGIVFVLSKRRMLGLNKLLNNELERQVTMLEREKEFSRRMHLGRLARWRIHLSDLEAMNFAIAELLLAALIIGAVVITINTGMSVGEVFAVLTYLIDLAEGMLVLPWTYMQSIRAQEIGSRIATT
ncbi:MAG: ABC transporter six-transmembrane domain-containing protein [Pseudomonadota bacterium]